MIKITRFKFLLPKSIIKLIPNNSPNFDPLESVHKDWMDKYNTLNFRKTLFFKGPLLYNDFMKACPVLSAKNCVKNFYSNTSPWVIQTFGNQATIFLLILVIHLGRKKANVQ